MVELIQAIAIQVRKELLTRYSLPLYGKCVEASEQILKLLHEKGIQGRLVQGVVFYDDDSTCSDRPYDEHTWVEVKVDNDVMYIDVTADQFQAFIDEDIPDIIVGNQPYYVFEVFPVEYVNISA